MCLYLYKQLFLVAAVVSCHCGAQLEPGSMTYHYIPEAQKQLVLTMFLRGMTTEDIMDATGMGKTTIFRIKRNWKRTGRVVQKSLEHGRPRVLSSLEVSVCALQRLM